MYFYYNKNQMSNYSAGFYFNYSFYYWVVLSIHFFYETTHITQLMNKYAKYVKLTKN